MSDLWNPDQGTKSSLSSGDRKIRLAYLKHELKLCKFPYCKKDAYYYENRHKYLTIGGSDHKCKAMPDKNTLQGYK